MYIKKTYRYANIVEVHKHHSSRYGDHGKRGGKSEETKEAVAAGNARRRREHMFRILAANFNEGDSHVTLTYKETPEDEKKEMAKFLRILRREAKKAGKDLKYIYVTEKGKKGKIHHHIVMSITDTALIRRTWKNGGVKISPLYPDKDYQQLAEYLLKQEEAGKNRYHGSRNLEIPQPETEVIKAVTWKDEPVPQNGYWIPKDSIKSGINADGYPYQSYKMVRVEDLDKAKMKQMEREADKYIKCRANKRKNTNSTKKPK